MKISVIIPVHNSEAYLRECLDSVLSQKVDAELEVIVTDDGSTDSSPAILKEYGERIHVITQERKGLSGARNSAIDMATGDWLTFVDSDDILLPGALSTMLQCALSTDSDMIVAQMCRTLPTPTVKKSTPEIITADEAIVNALFQNLNHSAWAKLYKHKVFVELRYTIGTWYEDLDLFDRVCRRCNTIAVIPDIVYYYRPSSNAFTRNISEGRLDVLEVTKNIESRLTDESPSLTLAARHRRLSACCNMAGLLLAHPHALPDKRHDVIEECLTEIMRLRKGLLMHCHTRLKNRVAIMLSYLPKSWFKRLLAIPYRKG